MKTIILITAIFLFSAGHGFGDEADTSLPEMTETQLKNQTREMIQTGIDKDEATNMTRLMLKNRFTIEQTVRAQKIVMQALKEGLPPEPIMNKAYEGMSKQADQENIIQAMEKVRSRYEFAYKQAGEISQDEPQQIRIRKEIQECVAAGMTEGDTKRLVYQLRYRVRELPENETDGLSTETFMAAKEMLRQRVRSIQATDVALEALDNNYGAQEMKSMRKAFIKHSAETSPQVVAKGYLINLQQGNRVENMNFRGATINGKSTRSTGQAGTTSSGSSGGSSLGSGTGGGAGSGHGGSRGRR